MADAPARLVVTTPTWNQEFTLVGERIVLGRDPHSDIAVDDRLVSRHHAELRRSGLGYMMVDLGSMNGLVTMGQRFEQRVLRDGDEIRIGQNVTLTYRASAAELAASREGLGETVMEVTPPVATPQPAAWAPLPPPTPQPAAWAPQPAAYPPPASFPQPAYGPQPPTYPMPPVVPPPLPGAYPPPSYGVPAPPPQAQGGRAPAVGGLHIRVLPLMGGIAVAVSSLLPWFASVGGQPSSNAFDAPVGFLIDPLKAQGGLKVGILVLLIGLAGSILACVPAVGFPYRLMGIAAIAIGGIFLVQTVRFVDAVNKGAAPGGKLSVASVIGFGVYAAIGGGSLLAAGK